MEAVLARRAVGNADAHRRDAGWAEIDAPVREHGRRFRYHENIDAGGRRRTGRWTIDLGRLDAARERAGLFEGCEAGVRFGGELPPPIIEQLTVTTRRRVAVPSLRAAMMRPGLPGVARVDSVTA